MERTQKSAAAAAKAVTPSEAAILGLLASATRDVSGYDLKKAIDRSVGYFWTPATSQIYAVLPRLVDAGLATRRDVAQTGRPDKQLYRITATGRRALRAWLDDESAAAEQSRNPLLLKVFFGEHGNPRTLLEQVRAHRREAEELLAALDHIEATPHTLADDFFPGLTRSYGREWAHAGIRWANAAERAIEERLRNSSA